MTETPKVRGVALHPLADLGLPLLLNLQIALAISLLNAGIGALAGRPILPGIGWWAMLLAMESFFFTGYFFVRELDMPGLLRWVEAVFILLVTKLIVTAPATGLNLSALTDLTALELWVGLPLLLVAWFMGMQSAHQTGALHPGLMPDLSLEGLRFNPHGEALGAIRRRVIGTGGWIAVLVSLVPVLGMGEPLAWPVPLYRINLGLVTLAVLAVGAMALGARLKQEIDWTLEGLQPPEGVLTRWIPQSIALALIPLLMAFLLPGGPRLPIERLIPDQIPQEKWVEMEFPSTANQISPATGLQEWMEQVAPAAVTLPLWLRLALRALAILVPVILLAAVLRVAWRQIADRVGWSSRGLLPLLRSLLRWYAALWQALWAGIRGGVEMAGRGAAAAARTVLGKAGALGRTLPIWGRPPSEPRAAIRYYFARLQSDAARRGLTRARSATAAEFGDALVEALPEQQSEIAELVATYEEARYGPDQLPGLWVTRSRSLWLLITKALGRR